MEARYNCCGLTASRLKLLDPYINMFNIIGGNISSCSEKFSNPTYFIHQWELEEERKLKALEEEKRLKKEERKNRKLSKAAGDTADGEEYQDQSGRIREVTSSLGSGALTLKNSVSALGGRPPGKVQDDVVNTFSIRFVSFVYIVCMSTATAK